MTMTQSNTANVVRARRMRTAFTLAEIMIALGVMAVGMGMVAGALHAGIQTHLSTTDDIYRTLIGENAVAIAKARLRHLANASSLTKDPTFLGSTVLGLEDRCYPVARASGVGYAMYGAWPTGAAEKRNDYTFWVLPFELHALDKGRGLVVGVTEFEKMRLTTTPTSTVTKFTCSDKELLKLLAVGEKVIVWYADTDTAGTVTQKLQLPLPSIEKKTSASAFDMDVRLLKAVNKGTPEYINTTVTLMVMAAGTVDAAGKLQPDSIASGRARVMDPYIARTALPK